MSRKFQVKKGQAFLFSRFGERLAGRYFSEEDLAKPGRYSRGKYKGKLRGQIRWEVCEGTGQQTRIMYSSDLENRFAPRVGEMVQARLMTWPWGKFKEPEVIAEWLYGDPVFETETEEETS